MTVPQHLAKLEILKWKKQELEKKLAMIDDDIINENKILENICNHKLIEHIHDDGYCDNKIYICEICNSNIQNPKGFDIMKTIKCNHELNENVWFDGHRNIRSYSCTICQKKIYNPRDYKIVKTHSG
jgi:hypothetical protein